MYFLLLHAVSQLCVTAYFDVLPEKGKPVLNRNHFCRYPPPLFYFVQACAIVIFSPANFLTGRLPYNKRGQVRWSGSLLANR